MTFLEIVNVLGEFNRYSGVPGILFFLLFIKSSKQNIRIVFLILLASFLADFSNYFFIRYVYRNGYIINNSWALINYFLVSLLYLRLIPARWKLISIFLAIFIIGGVISFTFFYSFLESNTFVLAFSSIVFTLLSMLVFLEILQQGPMDELSNYPVFWFTTGIFLFSSVTILKFLFQNYVVFEMKASKDLWMYTSVFILVFNIMKNLMFLYAFILANNGYPDYIVNSKPKND